MSERHVPVLLTEVVDALLPRDGARYVDGTFGAGGYTTAMLDRADCRVIAIDRDPDAIAAGRALAERYAPRLRLIEGRFGDMAELLSAEGVADVDGVALDLGVSSMQFDQAERGFSFRADGPLDMRMSREGVTAAELVNTLPEAQLADLIYVYGEEHHSRRVARVRCFMPMGVLSSAAGGVRYSQVIRPTMMLEANEARNGLRWSISCTSATRSTLLLSCACATGVNGPVASTAASTAAVVRHRFRNLGPTWFPASLDSQAEK